MGKRQRGAPREPGICRLNRIFIEECGEGLVDIRTYCRGIVVSANPSLLRESAAAMLQKAQDSLPDGYALNVHTALRTHQMQYDGYHVHLNKLHETHPDWPYSILRREANKFWHPPDQKAPPGHCTGGAVDVALLGPGSVQLDMRSTIREGIDPNPTYVRGLTAGALENRQLLIRVMTDAGFSNCADEWWHWSYGDNGWAARLGYETARYGMLTVDPDLIAAATIREDSQAEAETEEPETGQQEAGPAAANGSGKEHGT